MKQLNMGRPIICIFKNNIQPVCGWTGGLRLDNTGENEGLKK